MEKINILLKQKIVFKTIKHKDNNLYYTLTFNNDNYKSEKVEIEKLGFILSDKIWLKEIN